MKRLFMHMYSEDFMLQFIKVIRTTATKYLKHSEYLFSESLVIEVYRRKFIIKYIISKPGKNNFQITFSSIKRLFINSVSV